MAILQSPITITGTNLTNGVIGSSLNAPQTLVITIDNAFMQQVRLNNIVTQHPTTSGTPLNDNLARQAIIYQVDGILSSSTINGTLSVFNGLSFNSPFSYMTKRIQDLQTALLNPYIFSVNSAIVFYKSMALLNCDIKQEYKTINTIRVTLNLQELLLAPSTVSETQNNENRAPVNRGNQNG